MSALKQQMIVMMTSRNFILYKCNCPGKVHDVPYGIHQKIELQGHKFTCKICKQAITFFKNIPRKVKLMKQETRNYSLRMPLELKERLDNLSKNLSKPKSSIVREALEAYLNEIEDFSFKDR